MPGCKEEISSIVFDLGGVLIKNPVPSIIRFCAERLKADRSALARAHERHAPDFQRGKIAERVYWERVCRELEISPSGERSLWRSAFQAAYVEEPEMFRLAGLLHRKRYRIGLLSDTEIPSVKFFLPRLRGQFDFSVLSCREGSIKPEKRIFEIAISRSGVAPEKIIFIDDRQENVAGAKRSGLRAVLFRGPAQVKRELTRMGVEIGGD